MQLTDQQFLATSRTVALALLASCQAKHLSPDDTAAVTAAALTEVLGQILGPIGAIERLRDLADTFERQFLADVH